MFQRELAQRIASMPGSKDYGRLTVMLHYCADIKRIAEVQAHQFFPKPAVDSVVVKIKFRDPPEFCADNETFFFRVVKAAFSKRRKTLKNALAGSELHIEAKASAEVLKSVDIDPSRRAETLTVQEFVRLSNRLGKWLSR
jgi:16S rRNA (adenine1518-N6/adenine1519-N6)-dimethyltransferase